MFLMLLPFSEKEGESTSILIKNIIQTRSEKMYLCNFTNAKEQIRGILKSDEHNFIPINFDYRKEKLAM